MAWGGRYRSMTRPWHRLAARAGLLALLVNAFYPVPLTINVVAALADEATRLEAAGPHAHPGPAKGGHTHRGHADCALCGAMGGLACFSLPPLEVLALPADFVGVAPAAVAVAASPIDAPAGYRSRAPPPHA